MEDSVILSDTDLNTYLNIGAQESDFAWPDDKTDAAVKDILNRFQLDFKTYSKLRKRVSTSLPFEKVRAVMADQDPRPYKTMRCSHLAAPSTSRSP